MLSKPLRLTWSCVDAVKPRAAECEYARSTAAARRSVAHLVSAHSTESIKVYIHMERMTLHAADHISETRGISCDMPPRSRKRPSKKQVGNDITSMPCPHMLCSGSQLRADKSSVAAQHVAFHDSSRQHTCTHGVSLAIALVDVLHARGVND